MVHYTFWSRSYFQVLPLINTLLFYSSQKEYEMQKIVRVKGPKRGKEKDIKIFWNEQSQKRKQFQILAN